MQKGEVMSIATPASIIDDFDQSLFAVSSQDIYRLIKDVREFDRTRSVFLFGQNVHLTFRKDKTGTQQLFEHLKKNKHTNITIEKIQPTIEDCFIELMGKAENPDKE